MPLSPPPCDASKACESTQNLVTNNRETTTAAHHAHTELQHIVTGGVLAGSLSSLTFDALQHTATHSSTLQHIATHCNTLQHIATSLESHVATHCSTLQHTATHCNTLQHTATHCNTLDMGESRRIAYGSHVGSRAFPTRQHTVRVMLTQDVTCHQMLFDI